MNKLLLLFFISLISICGQNNYEKKYITVAPGNEYKANWIHEIFFGQHWRELWTTEINAEVLDLEKFDGGLKPIKRGGGLQTKSLRLLAPNGTQWKFRSINKDPSKVLPEEFRKTFAADILQDQISSANPMAPLIAAKLLKAVRVLQSEPILVYMPDDENLGEFREEFKNTLGFIEIHPDELDDGTSSIEGSDKVKGSYKLLETIEDKRSNRINSADFLTARLMDFLINDWDRHSDQWRWARFKNDSLKLWSPIPRDRDQAFAKYTGLFPLIASIIVPQLNHFGEDYSNIKYQSWSGRYLDRRFLIELSKTEWDSVTNYVTEKITDEVIQSSISELPNEYKSLIREEITSKLITRRNKLKEISNDFYELTNEVAHIYGTIDKDYVEINFHASNQTEILIYKLDKESGEKKESPIFKKTLDNKVTNEIRIFLLEDDDKVVVSGDCEEMPKVRIIGDRGEDEILNFSDDSNIIVYDSPKNTRVSSSSKIAMDDTYPRISKEPETRFEPSYNQQGFDFQVFPAITISSDDGILLGAAAEFWSYGFNKNPYEYYHRVEYDYSTELNSYSIFYSGVYNNFFNDHSVKFSAGKSEITFGRFFGFGNETNFQQNLLDNDHYKARQEVVQISPSILFNRKGKLKSELGLSYWYIESQDVNTNLLGTFRYPSLGLNGLKLLSLDLSINYSTVENRQFPSDGINIIFRSNLYFMENDSRFVKLNVDSRYYKSFELISETVLALRLLAEQNLGSKYPYYFASLLGGKNSLRGYERERFAGDGLLLFQSEIRPNLGRVEFIFPFEIGIILSAESGRVFVINENSSNIWHTAYGSGLFATILEGQFVISLMSVFSKESTMYYLRTKMGF